MRPIYFCYLSKNKNQLNNLIHIILIKYVWKYNHQNYKNMLWIFEVWSRRTRLSVFVNDNARNNYPFWVVFLVVHDISSKIHPNSYRQKLPHYNNYLFRIESSRTSIHWSYVLPLYLFRLPWMIFFNLCNISYVDCLTNLLQYCTYYRHNNKSDSKDNCDPLHCRFRFPLKSCAVHTLVHTENSWF